MQNTSEAVHLTHLDIDVCFLLIDEFYTGDPNDHKQLADPQYREHLDLPQIPRVVETLVRSEEIIGHEDKLIHYYKDIAIQAKKVNRTFNEIRQYFWLRFWMWNTEENVRFSFPWYDTLDEIEKFIGKLNNQSEGKVFSDYEQGWSISVASEGDLLVLSIGDESDQPHQTITISKSYVVQKLMKCEARSKEIIAKLTQALGRDVWSQYLDDADFVL